MHTPRPAARQTYIAIYLTLMVCTFLTWQLSYVDLGALNAVVALGIAVVKALLVLVFFMHVRDTRLAFTVIAAAILWLVVLLVLTLGDTLARG